MNFYRKVFSLLVFSAPLINFSLIPGSKLPFFYLIGIAGLLVFLIHNHSMSLRVFGMEDIFFASFIVISLWSWYFNTASYPADRGLNQIVNHTITYLLFKFSLILLYKTTPDPGMLLRRVFAVFTYWQIPAILIFFLGIIKPGWLVVFTEVVNNSGNFNIGALGMSLETARSFGFAPEPSFWSFFIAVNLAIALVIPKPNVLLLGINFTNLLLTVGRTGFLIATCILVIRFAKTSKLFKALLILGAFGLFIFGFDYLNLRSLQHIDPSFYQRIDSIFLAFDMAEQHPLLGIGLGNFRTYAETNQLMYGDIFNLFLNLLVSVGMPGLFLYSAFLFFSFERMKGHYNLPFYAAIIGWMTVSSYNLPFIWIVFSILIYTSEHRSNPELTLEAQ